MKGKRLTIATIACCLFSVALADDDTNTCANEWQMDSTRVAQLRLNVNSTLFFQDNEFTTPAMDGYTLPGFRLQPTVSYMPNPYVKVEGGVYLLKYWGTDSYPNLAYNDIGMWTGGENASKGFHILPVLRMQMATRGGLNIILGSIYGGTSHHLLEPLYATELNYTADPEAGAQVLYNNRWLNFDMWVNWQSFIYKNDDHQESFVFGLSTRLKYNNENSKLHLYSPIQALFHHRGGEINIANGPRVQTLVNGAVGIGARYASDNNIFRTCGLEGDLLLYNQQAGKLWPIKSGWAYYLHATADIINVKAKAGYMGGHKFVSFLGYPFYGSISTKTEGLLFNTTSTAYIGAEYQHEFAPGYSLGADLMIYQHWSGKGTIDGVASTYKPTTSFYGALCMRINPSVILTSKNR